MPEAIVFNICVLVLLSTASSTRFSHSPTSISIHQIYADSASLDVGPQLITTTTTRLTGRLAFFESHTGQDRHRDHVRHNI